jgi:DNA invertase Pin-like site-specific DNA recombinase
MKIGYARVSTQDQNLSLQMDALESAGCEIIYKEKISGASTLRPELEKMITHIRKGDTLIVWKLDRLARSLKDLLAMVNDFKEKKIGFISLNDPIDTTTAQGRLIFNIFGSLAEFEREVIRERTKSGLASARARGRIGGRPKGLSKESALKAAAAAELYRQEIPVNKIAETLKISKTTLYKYLRFQNVEIKASQYVPREKVED